MIKLTMEILGILNVDLEKLLVNQTLAAHVLDGIFVEPFSRESISVEVI